MAAKLTVVVPTCRETRYILQVIRDFKNQTYQDFKLLIIYDGALDNVWEASVQSVLQPNMSYTSIAKSKDKFPGTSLRNYGIELCDTEWISFFDDDDRAKDTYLETLMANNRQDRITITQMNIKQEKVYNHPTGKTTVVPESALTTFPVASHCGTPTAAVKTVWARNWPWQDRADHDYWFYHDIITNVHTPISIEYGVVVDVDGCTVGDLKDWVSKPPFIRD